MKYKAVQDVKFLSETLQIKKSIAEEQFVAIWSECDREE